MNKLFRLALLALPCFFALLSPDVRALAPGALLSYYSDDYCTARLRAIKELRENPGNPAPFLVLAAIYSDTRNFPAVRRLLHRMRLRWPDSPETALVAGEYLLLSGKAEKARLILERASDLYPRNASLLLSLAVLYGATGRLSKASALVKKAQASGEAQGPDDLVELASALLLLAGREGEVLDCIARCRRQYGESSQILFLEGMMCFRGGALAASVEKFFLALKRNLQNVNNLLMLVPLLSSLGQARRLLPLLEDAAVLFPEDSALCAALNRTRERVSSESLLEMRVRGDITCFVAPETDESALKVVITQTNRAKMVAREYLGLSVGRVAVRLLRATGVDAPAYYDAVNDEIYLGQGLLGYPANMARILKHEMGHLATARLLKSRGLKMTGLLWPSWFSEGLAECLAGAVERASLHAPLVPMSDEELLCGISVASVGRPSCRKAYAQACIMVDCLMGGLTPQKRCAAIVEFAGEISAGRDLDRALLKAFGMNRRELSSRVARRITEQAFNGAFPVR